MKVAPAWAGGMRPAMGLGGFLLVLEGHRVAVMSIGDENRPLRHQVDHGVFSFAVDDGPEIVLHPVQRGRASGLAEILYSGASPGSSDQRTIRISAKAASRVARVSFSRSWMASG